MTRALFIGRFQPFHKGHLHAAETAEAAYDLTVGVGSAETSHTAHNPLTFDERERVLAACIGDVDVVPVPDQDDNEAWLDFVAETFDFDVGISGNDLVQELFRSRGWPVEEPHYLEPDRFSGTAIRERVRAREPWRDRVPDCALRVLDDVGFVDRVRATGN